MSTGFVLGVLFLFCRFVIGSLVLLRSIVEHRLLLLFIPVLHILVRGVMSSTQ